MGVKWLRLVLLGIRRIPEKMLASLKKYHNIFKNSFQHGGISMEEMLIPVAVLEGK